MMTRRSGIRRPCGGPCGARRTVPKTVVYDGGTRDKRWEELKLHSDNTRHRTCRATVDDAFVQRRCRLLHSTCHSVSSAHTTLCRALRSCRLSIGGPRRNPPQDTAVGRAARAWRFAIARRTGCPHRRDPAFVSHTLRRPVCPLPRAEPVNGKKEKLGAAARASVVRVTLLCLCGYRLCVAALTA